MTPKINIFILHTNKDKALAITLEEYLYSLLKEDRYGIEIIRDDKGSDGRIKQSKTVKSIYNAHIVLPLITPDFILSDYNYEIADFLLRLHENRKIVAIPIIGKTCNWQSSKFGQLASLPNPDSFSDVSSANTIKGYENIAHGVQQIIYGIKVNENPTIQFFDRGEVIEELKELLVKNEFELAFKRLDEIVQSSSEGSQIQNELILLQSRYNSAQGDIRKGIISNENAAIERNNITYSLLSLIDDLPREIFNQDLSNIETYLSSKNAVLETYIDVNSEIYEDIQNELESRATLKDIQTLNEVKLVLVGNGAVGKTTLRKNLVNANYRIGEHESTVGLEVIPWTFIPENLEDIDAIKLNIWDFGGQGKYRSIQQFFCSHNSLYFFVTQPDDVKINKEDDYTGFEYWLSFVSAFGYNKATDEQSPVIYVVNKSDLRIEPIDLQGIQDKFPNIKGGINISCKTGLGLDDLKRMMEEYLAETKMIGREFNRYWLDVKKHLERLTAKHITRSAYSAICKEHGLIQEEEETLLNYLVAVGTVLYFPKTLSLYDYIILDPNWARELAYKAIDSKLVTRGQLKMQDAFTIWKSVQPQVAIDLLESFDLCYEIQRNGQPLYIMPSLFPKIKQYEKNNLGHFEKFMVSYECIFEPFIPAGIFQRLIVRQKNAISDLNKCWRNTAVLESNLTKAVIKEDWQRHKIEAFIDGKKEESIAFLIVLRKEIEDICKGIQKEKYLDNFTLKVKVLFEGREIQLHQILNFDGQTTIKHIEVKDEGTVQVADTINNIGNIGVDEDTLRKIMTEFFNNNKT